MKNNISTALRGRSIDVIVFPFSFREFLTSKGYVVKRLDLMSFLEERGRILGLLREYLNFGAYPEVTLEDDEYLKLKILKSYYDAIFYRDILERFNVRSPSLLDTFLRYCIVNHSRYISISKIHKYLKTIGYRVGKATLIDFLNYSQNAFFLFPLEIFSYSIKDRKQYLRKIYIIDAGILKALNVDTNIGRLMENAVFIELIRRSFYKNYFEIYYWKDRLQREVDFIIKDNVKIVELIQVTYASDRDEIDRREIKNLLKASDELRCDLLPCLKTGASTGSH